MYFIREDEPVDGGMVSRWTGEQMQRQAGFPVIGDRELVDGNITAVRTSARGRSTRTSVVQLMPLEFCWLDVPGPEAPAVPAKRW